MELQITPFFLSSLYFPVFLVLANSLPPKLTYMVKEEVPVHTFIGNILIDIQFPEQQQMNNHSKLRTDSLNLYELSVNGANLFVLDSETADLHTAARIDREAICPRSHVWPPGGRDSMPGSGNQLTLSVMRMMMLMTPANITNIARVEKCALEFAVVRKLRGSAEEQWVSLTIEIEDVDDNGPIFLELSDPDWSGSYNIWIGEDVIVGYQYPLPMAFDADTGHNALINYKLKQERNKSGEQTAFELDLSLTKNATCNDLPALRVQRPLDYEVRKEYTMELLACPSTENTSLNCSRLPIRVLIRDVNDNTPQLVYPSQSVHEMTVSESVSVGTILLKVEASDADDGEAGRLSFTLQTVGTVKNATQWITIDPSTGELRLARTISAHETRTIRVLIIISDNGTPKKSNQIMLVIHISDTNNHAPHIIVKKVGCNHEENQTNELTIDESIESQSHVGLVFVSDADLDQNGIVDCWAETMDNEIQKLFGIELKLVETGKMYDQYVYMIQANRFTQASSIRSLTTRPDRIEREIPFSTIIIICADKGKPYPLTSSIKLTVHVVERSGHELCFEQKSYSLQLVETNRVQEQLLRVQLQEINVRANFYLRPTSEENARPCEQFHLDPLNGALSIPNGIDREVAEKFECLIVAKEELHIKSSGQRQLDPDASRTRRTAQAKLSVRVADVNDNAPSVIPSLMVSGFSVVEWDSHLFENVHTVISYPFLIGTIIARDPDAGENGTITYQLQEVTIEQADQQVHNDGQIQLPRFDIQPHSGQVTLERDQHMLIDRESVQSYQLRVLLEDRGHVLKRSVITNLPIFVIDLNDNAPEWMPHSISPDDPGPKTEQANSAETAMGTGGIRSVTKLGLLPAPRLLQITWRKDPATTGGNEWLAELHATDRDLGENARLTFYKLDPNRLSIRVRGHVMDLPNEALEIYSDGTMKLLSTFLNPNWLYMSGVLVQDNGNSRKLQTLGYFYVNLSNISSTTDETQDRQVRLSQLLRQNADRVTNQQEDLTNEPTVFTEKFKLIFTILFCSGFVAILTCGVVCCLVTRHYRIDRSSEIASVRDHTMHPSLGLGRTYNLGGQYSVVDTLDQDTQKNGFTTDKNSLHRLPCCGSDSHYLGDKRDTFCPLPFESGVDRCRIQIGENSVVPAGYELSYPLHATGNFDLENTMLRITTKDV
ncbi:hypothetical protein FBUS_08615 [Fasciolopsis buskii]|uniref:Cadherin domain-containing protein n=1 Tax=Fasciolopsis buskii TaxID=27845 RepID=A0A8E0VF24_9TREM|nr:hypothetical protein FBUS_08615 [Fasciolopsis buski]